MIPNWLDSSICIAVTVSNMETRGQNLAVQLGKVNLLRIVKKLMDNKYFLEDISAIDVSEGFQVIYHFAHWEIEGRITLRVLISHDQPHIPSIYSIYSGADWHERECHDFFGIKFVNHPGLKPLLLPDDMKLRPLLKDDNTRCSINKILPLEQQVSSVLGEHG